MLDKLVDLGVKGNKLDMVIARSPQLQLRKSKDFFIGISLFSTVTCYMHAIVL
ncbi:hypothetical protein AHAS_Ahas09G0171500 [Arachis hypogaea]